MALILSSNSCGCFPMTTNKWSYTALFTINLKKIKKKKKQISQ